MRNKKLLQLFATSMRLRPSEVNTKRLHRCLPLLAISLFGPALSLANEIEFEIDLTAANQLFSADADAYVDKESLDPLDGFGGTAFSPTPATSNLWSITEASPTLGSFGHSSDTPATFPEQITRFEDLYAVQVSLIDGRKLRIHTHTFGPKIKIIPYGDGDAVMDAAGNVHIGDKYVAQHFKPGDIGFSIKHHRSANRVLNANDETELRHDIKLQDTHIGIVVGVMHDGKPGVMTINNPQNYQNGGFGDESVSGDYPMIFTKPVFPSDLPEATQQLMVDNIRTMLVGFNTVSRFPDNYDGGDPLAATTIESLREHVKMMVLAVAGNDEAQAFFEDPKKFMYCAELAYVATSAGVQVPLNRKTVLGLGVSEI